MKHQLIQIDPLKRVSTPIGGFPPLRNVSEGQEISAPDGHAYVPVLNKPAATAGKRAVKKLTEESDGWELVDFNEPPISEPKIKVTQLQLRLAILQTGIISLDALDQAIVSKGPEAEARWDYAPTIPIDHPLVLELANELNLGDEQVEELFKTASLIT